MSTMTNTGSTTSTLTLTCKGRRTIRTLIVIGSLTVAGVLTVVLWFGLPGSSAVASDGSEPEVYQQIIVQPGDTLWEISSRLSHDSDQAVVLEKILEYNSLETSHLEVGQPLYVPAVE
ncbi:hypothetical protein GCM10009720_17430 [Yaniella flava]|uniref:LysM domain-containing protein n=1 Tax=Yaniella flava TaxID=287930 RepID=A0ABP5G382_9MICC